MKRKPTRKRLTMVVRVSVPYGMTAAQARREVKTLISEQCNYGDYDLDDVKALAVRAVNDRRV